MHFITPFAIPLLLVGALAAPLDGTSLVGTTDLVTSLLLSSSLMQADPLTETKVVS
jgi:hypothetical protein